MLQLEQQLALWRQAVLEEPGAQASSSGLDRIPLAQVETGAVMVLAELDWAV
jgi:hypothetical protein